MRLRLKQILAFALCLFLFCGLLPVSAEQTVTTVTHYTMPSYFGPAGTAVATAGDINGDGKVNNKDLTRLFQYLSDWDVSVEQSVLDVNGDGKVNNKDLTRLFQYLSDWDVKIFPEPDLCEHEGGIATCCSRAICEKCGKEYGEFDPGNHSGGSEVRDAFAPSCFGNGYEGTTYCLGCGAALAYGDIIPAPGRHGETVVRGDYPATCGVSGYTGDTYCVVCGEKLAEGEYTLPTGEHLNFEYRNGYPATCSQMGYTGDVYCSDCGLLLYGGTYIEPTGEHTLGEWLSDSYIHWKECTECHNMFEQAQHTGGVATCVKKAVCEICGAEYGDYDTANHNYSDEVVAPTCFDVGYTKHTCLDCGFTYNSDYLPVLEHTGGVANCHSGAICELCGTEYGGWDYSNHDGGTRIEGAREPTETEYGYTGNVVCNGCNQVLEYGSYYGDHIHYGGNATYYQKAVCAECGKEYGRYAQILAYDQLNANQQGIYQILDTAVQDLNQNDISVFDYADDEATGESDINVAFRALSYDKPEYFWIPRSFSVGKAKNPLTGKLLDLYVSFAAKNSNVGEFHVTASQKAAMQQQLEQEVSNIVAGASRYNSDFDKEVYIHDYLCEKITYDLVAAASLNPDYLVFTAYGALVRGSGVCEGYSRAMQLICQRLDIPCNLIGGYHESWNEETGNVDYVPHMWNIINPGDGCYYLDVTFADTGYDTFPVWHPYFNITKEEMEIDHLFDDMYVEGHDYSSIKDEYNFFDTHGDFYNLGYYTNTGAYIGLDDASAAADYLLDAKTQGKTHADLYFDYSYLEQYPPTPEEPWSAAVAAVDKLNVALTLKGKMNRISDAFYFIGNYIYITIPELK